MNFGLDIGTGAIRSASGDARSDGGVDTYPAVTLALEEDVEGVDGEFDQTASFEHGDTTYLVGRAATRAAEELDRSPTPLFSNGVLEVGEPTQRALEQLISTALGEDSIDRLCYTTPGTIVDADEPTDVHRSTVATALEKQAVSTTAISKGFAVIYDQLAEDNYTGLGVCIESHSTSLALSYYGVPVLACTLAKGRSWIAEQAAAQTGHAPDQVDSVLSAFTLDPSAAGGGIERALAQAHDALAAALIEALEAQAAKADLQQGLSVPLAVAGDGAVEGIEFLLGGRFDAADLPVSVRGVRLAQAPGAAPARGALAAARDDVDAYEAVTWGEGGSNPSGAVDSAGTDDTDVVQASARSSRRADAGGADGDRRSTLSFDEDAAAEGADTGGDPITELFDRLGSREEAVDAVAEDLESVAGDLDAVCSTIDTVEEAVTRLEADLSSLEDETATIESRLETTASTAESASEGVASNREVVDSLEEELASAESTLESVADDITALEDGLDGVEASVERVNDDVRAVRDEVSVVREDVAADVEAVREEVTDVTADVETVTGEVKAVTADVDALETELATAIEDLETVDERVSATTADLETLSTDLEALAASRATTEDVEAIEDRTTALTDELTAVHDQTGETAQTVATLEAALASLSDAVEDRAATDRVESLFERLETVRADLSKTVDRVDAAADERLEIEEGLETAVAEVHADVVATRESLQVTQESLEAGIESVEDDLTSVRTALVNDIQRVEDDVQEVEDELETTLEDELSSVRTALENDIGTLESDVKGLANTLETDLEETRATLDEETDALERKIDESADTLATLRADVDDLESTSATQAGVRTLRTDLEADLGGLEDEVSGIEGKLDELEGEVSGLAKSLEALEDTVESELATHPTPADRPNVVSADALSTLETELEEIRSTVAALRTKLEAVAADVETDAEAATAIDDLAATVETLEGEAGDRSRALSALEDRVVELEGAVEADTEQSAPVDESAMESVRDQMTALESRLEAIESADGASSGAPGSVAEGSAERGGETRGAAKPRLASMAGIGGGSAGVVAGATAALTGATAIGVGIVVIGIVLLVLGGVVADS